MYQEKRGKYTITPKNTSPYLNYNIKLKLKLTPTEFTNHSKFQLALNNGYGLNNFTQDQWTVYFLMNRHSEGQNSSNTSTHWIAHLQVMTKFGSYVLGAGFFSDIYIAGLNQSVLIFDNKTLSQMKNVIIGFYETCRGLVDPNGENIFINFRPYFVAGVKMVFSQNPQLIDEIFNHFQIPYSIYTPIPAMAKPKSNNYESWDYDTLDKLKVQEVFLAYIAANTMAKVKF